MLARVLTVRKPFPFQSIRENWNLRYSAAYVLCLLRDTDLKPEDTIGASVAVVSALHPHQTIPPTNLLRVLDTEPKPENEVRSFA